MRAKLFVGNLYYGTTIDKLETVFRPFSGYLHTKICYERHTGKPLGYAVVHFENPASAQYAIDMLHNVEVDGRNIVVAPYKPRVNDATGSKPAPRPVARPGVDESVALVMDLHKNATWMFFQSGIFNRQAYENQGLWPIRIDTHILDYYFIHLSRDLKDKLSQQSKVLFVDEPRMMRAALVHFASEDDREQARLAFKNTHVLGSTIDVVPVDKDSIILGMNSGILPDEIPAQQAGQPIIHHGAVAGQPLAPAMLPVTYMPPGGMAAVSPYIGLDQSYQRTVQRGPMWQTAPMQPFVPAQYTMSAMQPAPPVVPGSAQMASYVASTSVPSSHAVNGTTMLPAPSIGSVETHQSAHPGYQPEPYHAGATIGPTPRAHSIPPEREDHVTLNVPPNESMPADFQNLVHRLALTRLSAHTPTEHN